jgi:hypothetical protein
MARVAAVALLILVAIAVAIGIWARASVIAVGSLWLDELWTLDAISRSFKEIYGARLLVDTNPPLWSLIAWGWLRVVGTYDVVAMRLLPLIFGLAAIAIPLLGAIRLPSLRLPMAVMGALAALSLLPLQYAVEVRSYSMLLALGSAATVIWAGLLVSDLPRWPRWIFLFCCTGALAGFTHHYGQLLYAGESTVLLFAFLLARDRRALGALVIWGVLSLGPTALWFALSSQYYANTAVAGPPEWSAVQTWLAWAFGPVSNVVAAHAPGYVYPDRIIGIENAILAASGAVILAALLHWLFRGRASGPAHPALIAGFCALLVLAFGVAGAWLASLVLPPSMNPRNLTALVPVLFLAIGSAAAPIHSVLVNRLAASAVVATCIASFVLVVSQHGVASLAPPWQVEAGYLPTARMIVSATRENDPPALIGLEFPWAWHGEWDAAFRSVLDHLPAESDDPAPLDVRWIDDVGDLRERGIPQTRLIVFTGVDLSDPRWTDVTAWVMKLRAGCEESMLGGPVYGAARVLNCPAAD